MTHRIGTVMDPNYRLIVHGELHSTQDEARALALAGEPELTAVMARSQTAGRGRLGRRWISPPDRNLALSIVLRPSVKPEEAALAGMAVSLAVLWALQAEGLDQVALKWPNDVLIHGKKAAGILSEARLCGPSVAFVVVGIGLNVNSDAADFPPELRDRTTSMAMASDRQFDVEQTARAILSGTEAMSQRMHVEGPSFIVPLWEQHWAHKGRVLSRNGTVGIAQKVAADGSLIMRTTEGWRVTITSGDVEPISEASQSKDPSG